MGNSLEEIVDFFISITFLKKLNKLLLTFERSGEHLMELRQLESVIQPCSLNNTKSKNDLL